MTSLSINFGVGNMILTRTDVSNPTPTQIGVIQDCEVDFDFTNKDLIGQNQFPVDVARAQGKISGKAKSALIKARNMNDAFFGAILAPATGIAFALNEAQSVPGTSTYTITVTHAGTFVADQGVFYAVTGASFTVVASSPALGQYSFNATTGVYTFAAADASAAVLINYTYGVTTGYNEIQIANQLMGSSPVFSMLLANTYKGNVLNFQLNACISTKMTFPLKNIDYTINDLEFQAYADAAGNIAKITTSQ